MTQLTNQFRQSPEIGSLDLNSHNPALAAQVSDNETSTIALGQAVKIEDSSGGVPRVLALGADTEEPFGFVIRNIKDENFEANDHLSVAIDGSIMFMESGAAVTRGGKLEYDVSANQVINSAGSNPVIGRALDKAGAAGEVIRVLIQTPGDDL